MPIKPNALVDTIWREEGEIIKPETKWVQTKSGLQRPWLMSIAQAHARYKKLNDNNNNKNSDND